MFFYCKLCGNCLILQNDYGELYPFECHFCKEYDLLVREGNQLYWEAIRYKNIRALFFHQGDGSLRARVETVHLDRYGFVDKVLYSFSLDQLTPDLAVKWLQKIKTYVLFQ
jgi:hypothetical protein